MKILLHYLFSKDFIEIYLFFCFFLLEDELYEKTFHVGVALDGITEQHKPVALLPSTSSTGSIGQHNRTRHLSCQRNVCQEFTVMHLGFLNYAHYIITVQFYGLEGFHRKYNVSNLTFYVRA